MPSEGEFDVIVIGGGVAGCSAGIFTSRQGLDTLIFDTGESMLSMNAHLENYPGFPRGINPRLLLDLLREQAEVNGCDHSEKVVEDVDRHPDGGFVLSTEDSDKFEYRTRFLVGATAGNVEYLRQLDVSIVETDHGAYVESDEAGRTDLEGLYVAGGLANKPLQAAVSVGHGVEVALSLLGDAGDVEFAHDWTVPDGFFSDGGSDPPGCEEISEDQREEREERSMTVMREAFEEPHPDDPG